MNDEERAEKIALAKKKLRAFEARRHEESSLPSGASSNVGDGRSSALSVNSSSNGHVDNGVLTEVFVSREQTELQKAPVNTELPHNNSQLLPSVLSNVSSSSSFQQLNGNMNGGENVPVSAVNHQSNGFSEQERLSLIAERDQALVAYDQLKKQMDELHSYYTQLHSAYSQLSASGIHSDAEKQILQLQSAVAHMVEEKTALQSELRASKEKNEKLMKEAENSTAKPENEDSISPAEIRHLKMQLESCKNVLSARNEELESQRKQTSDAQAQLLAVQHERSEAQARLKVLFREKDSLEADVRQLRKDVQMKDIYLKQMSAHNTPMNTEMDEGELKRLNARIDSLEAELSSVREEKNTIERDSEVARRQYEQYGQELAEKARLVQAELEEAESQRGLAEKRAAELEQQLQLLSQDLESSRQLPSTGSEPPSKKQSIQSISEEDVVHRIEDAVRRVVREWERRLDDERKQREQIVMHKDQLLFEREQALAEANIRYTNLEERTNEIRANQTELLSLSEDLQNEKATVSRALAQNRELKEQIIETEDRLVSLTNEKLQCELARQAAEHEVKQLKSMLESGDNDKVAEPAVVAPNGVVEEEVEMNDDTNEASRPAAISMSSVGTVDGERERGERERELEYELNTARQQLDDMRNDLRRSHTQNEEMNQIMMLNAEDENQNSFHVELGQAMNRIHALSAENEQLKQELNRVQGVLEAVETTEEDRKKEKREKEEGKERDEDEMGNENEDCGRDENVPLIHELAQNAKGDSLPGSDSSSTVGSSEWARAELEKKFGDAMRRVANLQEALDKVEHINMQLQLENDTIADHVVLYQHQRRLIRERLRAKDMQLASLENERVRVVDRCQELQKALMTILEQNGALKEYSISPSSRSNSISKKSSSAARRVSRTFSHSTVDELSGDEDVVVKGENEEIPTREELAAREAETCEAVSSSEEGHSPTPPTTNDAAVQKILSIINDISAAPSTSYNEKLHCTQCIGELKSL